MACVTEHTKNFSNTGKTYKWQLKVQFLSCLSKLYRFLLELTKRYGVLAVSLPVYSTQCEQNAVISIEMNKMKKMYSLGKNTEISTIITCIFDATLTT